MPQERMRLIRLGGPEQGHPVTDLDRLAPDLYDVVQPHTSFGL